MLFLGSFSLEAQSPENNTDWQQRIDHIEQMSGRTPWQWATDMSVQWFDMRSSQNRSISKTTTSPKTKTLLTPITDSYQLEGNQLILAANFGRMLHTQIQVNDEPFKGHMEPAGFDTLTTYSYTGLPEQVSINCKWSIAGEVHHGILESPLSLADWMSKCDPSGKWKLNPVNHQIEGKMDKVACGNLEIKVAKKSKKIKIEPVVRYQPMGTIIHLDKGTQFLSFQEPGNPVKESLVLEEPVKEVKPQGIPTKFESPVVAYIKQPNNSFLLIQDLERMPDHQLSVFNRWGKEISHFTIPKRLEWNQPESHNSRRDLLLRVKQWKRGNLYWQF